MMEANWNYIVAGICILLAVFLVWQEYSRANKKWLWLRVAAVLITATMLACIALPISYQKNAGVDRGEEFVLLTDGFNADSLKPNQKVFTMDAAVKKAYPKAALLNNPDELTDTLKAAPVHIYGYGLNDWQLAQLDSSALVFHPSPLPSGVTHIGWNAKLKAGEVLDVQGSYNNASAQRVMLLLKGLNTVLDTVAVKPNSRSSFELSAKPKTSGRMIYSMQAVTDGDTVTLGNIPLQIDPVKPVRVLMLSASPGFETKFLKNWLGQNGYAVAVRSAISKDKYNSEFINTPLFSLDKLSLSTLNKFDVVIGDLSTLNALSGADAASLKQEVENNGLGIIVRADNAGKTGWLQKDFPLIGGGAEKELVSTLILNGQKSASAKLNIGNSFIRYQNGTQPLVLGAQNKVLANSATFGPGKVVFTTLGNTYSWALGGNQQDYSALWSALISTAARRDTAIQQNIAIKSLPVVGEPVQLAFTQSKFVQASINGESIASEQNPAIPFEWSAPYWAGQPGWQSFTKNGKTEWWYAYDKGDWKALQAAEKIAATAQYATENKRAAIVTKQIHQKIRIEVPKIYFYILLLAAFTFLWVEKKLS